jgi:carbonic anhydrase
VRTSEIRVVTTAEEWSTFRALAIEYAEYLGENLCFQGFDDEITHADHYYGAPDGIALLAHLDGEPVGCAGVHRFAGGDAELKRMYVQERARGHGLGFALANRAIAFARERGYERVLLDTLSRLHAALHVYAALGFREIDAYRPNPLAGVRYLALDLS